jgi:hypothetical protein
VPRSLSAATYHCFSKGGRVVPQGGMGEVFCLSPTSYFLISYFPISSPSLIVPIYRGATHLPVQAASQNKGLIFVRFRQDGKNFQAACIPFRFATYPEVSSELHLLELALITISSSAWN